MKNKILSKNCAVISLSTLFLFGIVFSQTNVSSKSKIDKNQAKSISDSNEKKFHKAKALENAKLIEEAKKLYLEINREKPGVSRYFTPLKN